MEAKIKTPFFVESENDTDWGIVMPDGKIIDLGQSMAVRGFDYQTKFNPSTYEFPYDGEDAICLNDIYGQITEVHCYKEFDVDYGYNFRLTEARLNEIIGKFKTEGFDVTEDAIRHQYDAWRGDYKSGYRDEERGYHLFTPCGCNPFSIRATTLHEKCKDWQITYEC